jgi:hypothetical protein
VIPLARSPAKAPILIAAAVILAVGLAVILSSFFRETIPRFTGDLEPLLRAGVLLFFLGAAYFLAALVSLFAVKRSPGDEDGSHGAENRATLRIGDPAIHVATAILVLVGAAVCLTVSIARPEGPAGGRPGAEPARSGLEATLGESSPLTYYACQGAMTEPGPRADRLDDLPTDIESLVEVVQGLLLHVFWTEAYGTTLTEERRQEAAIRSVSDMLARILELSDRPLAEARDVDKRLVTNCRGYSVLLTAVLRHQGIPARARCGFATYFVPGEYTDHWVTDYWNARQDRWVTVDGQLDGLQLRTLGIDFDPLDLPPGAFLTGGDAWLTCRAGNADPEKFGIMDIHGMSIIRGNVGHDFWALNKVETLPWEGWGVPWKEEADLTDADLMFVDEVARLTLEGDGSFRALRALHNDPRLRPPDGWPSD